MADGMKLKMRLPKSLYKLCITAVVDYLYKSKCDRSELRTVPENVLIDLYVKMFKEKRQVLAAELRDLDVFMRVLKASSARLRILKCFQAVIELGINLPRELSTPYLQRCDRLQKIENNGPTRDALIDLGLRLGGFLNEAGWYADAEMVLLSCRDLCQNAPQTTRYVRLTLECCHRLLHTQAAYCCFPGAADTYALSLSLLGITDESIEAEPSNTSLPPVDPFTDLAEQQQPNFLSLSHCRRRTPPYCRAVDEITEPPTEDEGMNNLLLRLYKEFSVLHFVRSNYNATYKWSAKALKLLRPDTPPKITVDVLRICGKACVMMREFSRAGLLMQQVVALARTWFGKSHPKYAFALLDYGFYLLNVDSILHSVTVYEEALGVLKSVYDGTNLHVAVAHEDLSYALYVHEYSTGRFYKAREHADRAIILMESLLPSEHLMLATAKRIKALILEEIALDTLQESAESELLAESEALHRTALNLSMMAFGEKNVQTAKHYGNLGRLYQSMRKFEQAEEMQLRAIAIKEELLGRDDYEVGLSIGHLASLYNYHMSMYSAAEKLYFRSISISLKLFGERYSGLEYDYLGLVHVNTELEKPERAAFYTGLLEQWRSLRNQPTEEQQPALGKEIAIPIPQLKLEFFKQDDKD